MIKAKFEMADALAYLDNNADQFIEWLDRTNATAKLGLGTAQRYRSFYRIH